MDLTDLFQIIQSDVKCMVVVLSPGLFGSPWCTGEICTAFAGGLPKVSFVLEFLATCAQDIELYLKSQKLSHFINLVMLLIQKMLRIFCIATSRASDI